MLLALPIVSPTLENAVDRDLLKIPPNVAVFPVEPPFSVDNELEIAPNAVFIPVVADFNADPIAENNPPDSPWDSSYPPPPILSPTVDSEP